MEALARGFVAGGLATLIINIPGYYLGWSDEKCFTLFCVAFSVFFILDWWADRVR